MTATSTVIMIRRTRDRGTTQLGWLHSRHSFSFGRYLDRDWMGFGPIRVINDDRVAGGGGFPTHPHENMEIISYIVSGALAHKDSTGTTSTIPQGGMQRMTAGSGVTHSEFNPSQTEPTRFLQIWIEPSSLELPPSHQENPDVYREHTNELISLVTPDGRDGSLKVHQDVTIQGAKLDKGESVRHAPRPNRRSWIQIVQGDLKINGVTAGEGDGIATAPGIVLEISALSRCEFLLFDVA